MLSAVAKNVNVLALAVVIKYSDRLFRLVVPRSIILTVLPATSPCAVSLMVTTPLEIAQLAEAVNVKGWVYAPLDTNVKAGLPTNVPVNCRVVKPSRNKKR